MMAPVIPALTDHEIEHVLEAAVTAGARRAAFLMLRLPHEVAPLFEQWLRAHYPERADRVLNHVREMRGGRLNDPRFGHRMRGEGAYAAMVGARLRGPAGVSGSIRKPRRNSTCSSSSASPEPAAGGLFRLKLTPFSADIFGPNP